MDLSQSISSAEDSHARTYRWQEIVRDWLAHGAPYSLSSPGSSKLLALAGFLSRTSQDCYLSALAAGATDAASYYDGIAGQADLILKAGLAAAGPARQPVPSARRTVARTLDSYLRPWLTWGIGGPTGSLTVRTGESHSAAVACTLSAILEPHAHQKYSLSPKACMGILRRARKRRRKLPQVLERALADVAARTTGTDLEHSCHLPPATQPGRLTRKNGLTLTPRLISSTPGRTRSPTNSPLTGKETVSQSCNPLTLETSWLVRRLTPTEAERLQGFPDGWTLLPMDPDTLPLETP